MLFKYNLYMHWVNYLFLYNGSNTIKWKKYWGKLVKNLMKNSPFLSQSEVKKIKIICSNQCKTNNNHLIYTHLKFVNPTISSILTALGVALYTRMLYDLLPQKSL